MGKSTAKEIAITGMFVAIITVCSWITVPFVVPFTLQTFAVYLAIFTIGEKKAFIAFLSYCLIGLTGVPVFSGFRGGVSVLIGATGGYLIGFFLSIFVTWIFSPLKSKKIWYFISIVFSLLICYAFGTLFFVVVYMKGSVSFYKGLTSCVFPFIIPDLIKIVLSYLIAEKIRGFNLKGNT